MQHVSYGFSINMIISIITSIVQIFMEYNVQITAP